MDTNENERGATCEKPLFNIYNTPFHMDSCMHHCEKLGSRVPSVTTFEKWTKLQTYLKKNLFDKGLYTRHMWLPITDREIEGVWKDFYTGEVCRITHIPGCRQSPMVERLRIVLLCRRRVLGVI